MATPNRNRGNPASDTGAGDIPFRTGPEGDGGLAWYRAQDGQTTWDALGEQVSRWPVEVQEDLFRAIDSGKSTENADPLQQAVQRSRQKAFKAGEILPGVDRSGGGTGLSKDEVRSILTQQRVNEAEDLQGQLPGEDAYTEDAVLDKGPGYSLLDRLRGESAFLDEDIDALDLSYEDALAQTRTDTTGRDAQERSLADYDAMIAQEGLTDIDRARVEQLRQDTARRARSQEAAIMQDAAEKGRASGNLSFLMRNQSQQAATNERALGDMRTAALGLERKDQAIRNRGFLGGDIQNADDAIDRFNTQNSQEVLQRNTDRTNRGEVWEREMEEGNKAENVDVTQGAIGVDYDSDTARSDQNTDRTNAQNASNDQGRQRRYQDMWSAFGSVNAIEQGGPAYNNEAGRADVNPGSPGSNGLAEAGQGAVGGAAAGSAFGPWGAAIGAGVGGAAGFLGGRQKRTRAGSTSW